MGDSKEVVGRVSGVVGRASGVVGRASAGPGSVFCAFFLAGGGRLRLLLLELPAVATVDEDKVESNGYKFFFVQ